MKVLVACEESQEVCKAFRALGHMVDDDNIVALVEEWSAAHPRKTWQSVFLEQYPEAEIDKCGCLMLCPKRISADCRREFWMQEVE